MLFGADKFLEYLCTVFPPEWHWRNPQSCANVMSSFFKSMSLKVLGFIILRTPLTISSSVKFSLTTSSICWHTLLCLMSDVQSPISPLCTLNSCWWRYERPLWETTVSCDGWGCVWSVDHVVGQWLAPESVSVQAVAKAWLYTVLT